MNMPQTLFVSSTYHDCTWQVDVCDKVEVSSSDPSLDASYYSTFSYTLLDGSGEIVSFDSTPAKDPTGEVQVRLNKCLTHLVVQRTALPQLASELATMSTRSGVRRFSAPRSRSGNLNEQSTVFCSTPNSPVFVLP